MTCAFSTFTRDKIIEQKLVTTDEVVELIKAEGIIYARNSSLKLTAKINEQLAAVGNPYQKDLIFFKGLLTPVLSHFWVKWSRRSLSSHANILSWIGIQDKTSPGYSLSIIIDCWVSYWLISLVTILILFIIKVW